LHAGTCAKLESRMPRVTKYPVTLQAMVATQRMPPITNIRPRLYVACWLRPYKPYVVRTVWMASSFLVRHACAPSYIILSAAGT
jgi:hypothetical protein